MVLAKNGSLWASGKNMNGQLGDGSRIDRTRFVQVASENKRACDAVLTVIGNEIYYNPVFILVVGATMGLTVLACVVSV